MSVFCPYLVPKQSLPTPTSWQGHPSLYWTFSVCYGYDRRQDGNGIQEVVGSTPIGSTNSPLYRTPFLQAFALEERSSLRLGACKHRNRLEFPRRLNSSTPELR